MRWVFAGLCFAVLVGLGVATVAIRAGNVAARGRIWRLESAAIAESTEVRRRQAERRDLASRPALLARLRELERLRVRE